MKKLFKPFKMVVFILAFTALAPFALARMGYWSSASADTLEFKEPFKNSPAQQGPFSYSTAVERAAPAVVSVSSTKELSKEMNPMMNDPLFRQFFGDPRQGGIMPESQPSIASGVIVSHKGYILTNNHVVKDADNIEVKLSDGRSAKAKVIGTDPDSDLAILKVELEKLPVIAIGNSATLRVGDVVLAIGNPFAVGQTVTQGIVSATQRTELGINIFESFIQTDAAINPGNSGGALIDANGNLVGINNAIFTRTGGHQGIGFAIPVDLAKDVMGELIEHGYVTRGWLGITVRGLNDELRKSLKFPKGEGVVIAGVIRNGPAHKSGILPMDIITHLNNKTIKDPSAVLNVTSELKPEDSYAMTIIRNGEIMDFKVMVGKRPNSNPPKESKS